MTKSGRPTENEPLSAEVVLRGPFGAKAPPITSANIRQHQPDPAQVALVRRWFEDRGFTTSGVTGISFSLTGTRALFNEIFRSQLGDVDTRPGVDVLELPLSELPDNVANAVDCVTFSAPPDFGPPAY